jgi:hypothetical protein
MIGAGYVESYQLQSNGIKSLIVSVFIFKNMAFHDGRHFKAEVTVPTS